MSSMSAFPQAGLILPYSIPCRGKARYYLAISLILHGFIFILLIKASTFPVLSATSPVDIEIVAIIEASPSPPEEMAGPEETAELPTPEPPLPPSAPEPEPLPPPSLASVVQAPPLEPPFKPQPQTLKPPKLNRPLKIHRRAERPAEITKPPLQAPPTGSLPASTIAPPVASPPPATLVPAPRLASSETIQSYGRRLWMRILRHKPERIVAQGSTALNFAVSPEGELISVAVTQTSGTTTLDSASIAAVRAAAPFPAPPPGALPSDLVFSIAFDYH